MRLLVIFFLVFTLYGKTPSKETCYTVQLISSYNTPAKKELFNKRTYDESCRVLEVGKMITVRCGCFQEKEKAKDILNRVNNEYKQALIMKTYSYRFKDMPKEKIVEVISTPKIVKVIELEEETVEEEIESTELNTTTEKNISKIIEKKISKKKKKPKKKKKVKKAEPLNEEIVIEEKKKKKPKKKKKKVKKIESLEEIIEPFEENIDIQVEEKKKKLKKVKYVKKRPKRYFYDKYLQNLKSQRAIGPYRYNYEIGAQFSYDFVSVSEANIDYQEEDWRRIRVFHKGSFFNERLFYEIEYSFLGEGAYKDVLVGYTDRIKSINTEYRVKFGNIKIPFSLETYTSSKYITFMERALTDSFSIGRKLGGELLLSTKFDNNRINLFGAFFSNSINERTDNEVNMPGFSARGTYSYKFNKTHLFSIGGAFMYQDLNKESIKFKQGSESDFIKEKYVSTKVKNVYSLKKNNIEFLYINNKFSLQAEYVKVLVDAKKDKYSFDAYYIEGSYFVIGRGKRYKFLTSTLANVKPTREGALEIAFRYSSIDLNDDGQIGSNPENGGSQIDYNYGLNWYLNKELKFTLNYVVGQPKGTDEYDGLLQLIQARVLFAF